MIAYNPRGVQEVNRMRKCKVCGAVINDGDGYFVTKKGDVCSSECHTEMFWSEKIDWAEDCRTEDEEPVFRFNGEHYVIGAEDAEGPFRGSAGRVFYVYYHVGPFAGKIFRTTNLWSQGKIPEKYQNELPDNASLMSTDDYHNFAKRGMIDGVPVVVFKNIIDGESKIGQWAELRFEQVSK